MSDQKDCQHEKCIPKFDLEVAKCLGANKIRKMFPRFEGECPDCKRQVIAYASYDHYIYGDW